MKKLLSLFSILSYIVVFSSTVYAWVPTNFTDPKCLNVNALGKTENIIMLGRKGESICGCSKCTVDAVSYGKLYDYIGELKKRFDALVNQKVEINFIDRIKDFFDSGSLIKSKIYLENRVKINNIKCVLTDIVTDIENKKFLKSNFLLVSTNYDPNGPDAIAQFVKSDSIVYKINYNEAYFRKIKNEKILPLLDSIEEYLKK